VGIILDRKLYRSSNDKILAGVCGGIAEYFALDSVIVRLLWVVFTLMGGAGLLAYIIAAIIIPGNPMGGPVSENYSRSDSYDSGQRNGNAARSSSLVLGVILILFGASVLLKDFIPFIPRDMILAAALIGLGIFFLVRKSK
jgi:phage shock protein C